MKLYKRPLPANNISWADVIFQAEAQKEPFDDIVIQKENTSFVKKTNGKIVVGFNGDVKNDDMLFVALDMVAEALSIIGDHDGVVYFVSDCEIQADILIKPTVSTDYVELSLSVTPDGVTLH